MRYDLKRPCAECPFRRSSLRGFLGPLTGQPAEFVNPIAGRMEIQPGVFVGCEPVDTECHMDLARQLKEIGFVPPAENLQHCAGALLFLVNDLKLPHDQQKVDAMHRLERRNDCRDYLGNVREFVAHHTIEKKKKKTTKGGAK